MSDDDGDRIKNPNEKQVENTILFVFQSRFSSNSNISVKIAFFHLGTGLFRDRGDHFNVLGLKILVSACVSGDAFCSLQKVKFIHCPCDLEF